MNGQQPVAPAKPSVVHIDLANAIPRSVYNYLLAFLPGLFFEISVALTNPELMNRIAANIPKGMPFGPYLDLAIALLLAFIIGHGFMLVSSLLQWTFGYVIVLRAFVWRQVCKWPLRPLLIWLCAKPFWRRRSWLANWNSKVTITGFFGSQEWKKLQGCWYHFAKQLLKRKYRIDAADIEEDEWPVLWWTLGTPTGEEMRGSLIMMATHAIGWAGVVAAKLAPALRNPYFLGFSGFMILNGVLHDFSVADHLNNPRLAGYLNVRASIRELEKVRLAESSKDRLALLSPVDD